ncbi:MAG: histone deacetylase [Candidatus Dormiibacterota bacterium]
MTTGRASPLLLVSTGPAPDHEAPGHPERPDRVAAVLHHLARLPDLAGLPRLEPAPADAELVELAHTPEHVAHVRHLAEHGGGWIDADTYCRPGSYAAALRSAGAGIAGLEAVLEHRSTHAFSLSRPPGHHATAGAAMGFCLFNNVAILARRARGEGVQRIAVIDIDVHHGNGTEEIFWDDPSVLYTSLHQWPLYPGTGAASARGGASASGLTVNLPIAPGASGEEWLGHFDKSLLPAVREFRPELVLVSAGYDAHAADPLASLRLTAATYAAAAERVAALCAERGIGSVWLLEGGYDLEALAESVAATLSSLSGSTHPPVRRV